MNKSALLVLNYNCEQYLKNCISSLIDQSLPADIYIIDNASTDDSLESLSNYGSQINIIRLSKNLGVGVAFNTAIKGIIDKYEYFGFFNADVIVDSSWHQEVINYLSNNQEVYVAASFTKSGDNKIIDTLGGAILNFPLGVFGGYLGDLAVSKLNKKIISKPFPVFFGLITGMMVNKQAFIDCGYFDEKYFIYYEDIDFCWRVLLSGKKVYCLPTAILNHYGHGSISSLKSHIFISEKSETNLLATYYKNLSHPFLLLPFTIFFRLLLSFLFFFQAPSLTFSKIKGVFIFINRLFNHEYHQGRIFSQSLRKITDSEVFSNNPQSLYGFGQILLLIPAWKKHVFKK